MSGFGDHVRRATQEGGPTHIIGPPDRDAADKIFVQNTKASPSGITGPKHRPTTFSCRTQSVPSRHNRTDTPPTRFLCRTRRSPSGMTRPKHTTIFWVQGSEAFCKALTGPKHATISCVPGTGGALSRITTPQIIFVQDPEPFYHTCRTEILPPPSIVIRSGGPTTCVGPPSWVALV